MVRISVGFQSRLARLALAIVIALTLANSAPGQVRGPFAVPKDRSAWESKRAEVRSTLLDAIHLRQEFSRTEPLSRKSDRSVPLVVSRPGSARSGERLPAILLFVDAADAPDAVRLTSDLVACGYLVAIPQTPPVSAQPWRAGSETRTWTDTVRDDKRALDELLRREDVDRKRIGVAGIGTSGMRAWWLMGLDERITCGVAAGGIIRIGDARSAQGKDSAALAPWAETLLKSFDTEAVMALCAPRHLQIMGGDRDPNAPASGFQVLRDTTRKAYAALRDGDLSYTLYGGQGDEFTDLQAWSMLETFDKAFLPQGPAPLGHASEPEPKLDDAWINPAEHGLAGWVPEMSQRPGTWTWSNGVITCQPGKSEYGWLRMPVELEDFVLRVEWRVPKGGNTGIFLRARPVEWTLPPSEASKLRVSTLGATWPSRTGLELQAQDDPGNADKYSSGSLYRHAAPASNPTHPPGEWNRYTVRCRGLRVEVWSNGRQVLDTTLDRYPNTLRNPPRSGYLGLQNHGVSAEFRNLHYMKIDAANRP